MTQTEISSEKIEAYMATHYSVAAGSSEFVLRIGEFSAILKAYYDENAQTCCLFITAYSPYGQAQSQEANEQAHVALGNELRIMSPLVTEGEGGEPSSDWPVEKSYLAFGLQEEPSRILGTRYRQDAVVWVGADAIPKLLLLR